MLSLNLRNFMDKILKNTMVLNKTYKILSNCGRKFMKPNRSRRFFTRDLGGDRGSRCISKDPQLLADRPCGASGGHGQDRVELKAPMIQNSDAETQKSRRMFTEMMYSGKLTWLAGKSPFSIGHTSFLKALFFHLPLVSFNQRGPHSYRTPLGPVVTVAGPLPCHQASHSSTTYPWWHWLHVFFFRPFQRDFWLRDPLSLKAVKDVIEVDPKKTTSLYKVGCEPKKQMVLSGTKSKLPSWHMDIFFHFLVFFWLGPTKFSWNMFFQLWVFLFPFRGFTNWGVINEDGEALHCDGRCPVDLNGVSRGCQGAQTGI